MISQIKAVPPPDTSEGKAAKQQINQLATQVQTTSTAVKTAASQLPANASVTQIISALSGLVPQFTSLKNSAQSTAKAIQDAGGSLDAMRSRARRPARTWADPARAGSSLLSEGELRRLADAEVADPLVDRVRGRVRKVGVEEAEAAAAREQSPSRGCGGQRPSRSRGRGAPAACRRGRRGSRSGCGRPSRRTRRSRRRPPTGAFRRRRERACGRHGPRPVAPRSALVQHLARRRRSTSGARAPGRPSSRRAARRAPAAAARLLERVDALAHTERRLAPVRAAQSVSELLDFGLAPTTPGSSCRRPRRRARRAPPPTRGRGEERLYGGVRSAAATGRSPSSRRARWRSG